MAVNRWLTAGTMALTLVPLTLVAQQTPKVLGGVSSTAAIEIDGTAMSPAPSWPLVDRDVIRTTSAPGLILTSDQNSITLLPETTARIRQISEQTWVFVRTGGLTVATKNRNVMVCIGNRVFQPTAQTTGALRLEKTGSVANSAAKGILTELKANGCGEELAAGMVALPAGVVAGTTGVAGGVGTAVGGTATAAGAAGVGAATVAAVGASAGLAAVTGTVAVTSDSCASSSGCNFNPAPVTPSTP